MTATLDLPRAKKSGWDLYSPFGIGIDHLFDQLDTFSKTNTSNYPPHNIIKHDDNNYDIEMAVAGFNKEDISIEQQDSVLTISASHKENKDISQDKNYIHKGISTRSFERRFTLAEHVVVHTASVSAGILTIKLALEIPEEKLPRQIEIH